MLLSAGVGAGLVGAGVYLGWQARRAWRAWINEHNQDAGAPEPLVMGMSPISAFVVALSLVFVGYHLAAWVLPGSWTPLKVPVSRWWMVLVGAGVAVCGSLLMDRRDAGRSDL